MRSGVAQQRCEFLGAPGPGCDGAAVDGEGVGGECDVAVEEPSAYGKIQCVADDQVDFVDVFGARARPSFQPCCRSVS